MQIAEYRLNDAKPSTVKQPAFTSIDPCLHRRGLRVHILDLGAIEEGHLPIRTNVRLSHAVGLERTGVAKSKRSFKADPASTFDDDISATEFE